MTGATLARALDQGALNAGTGGYLQTAGIGRDGAALRAVATEFDAMIREDGPAPDDWPDLACFRPVHAAKSRHECVLLPFRAAVKALEALDGE